MNRLWAGIVTAGTAVWFLGFYAAMQMSLPASVGRAARQHHHATQTVPFGRVGSFFVDLSPREDALLGLGGWEWLPRLVMLVVLLFLIYNVARRSASAGRAAAFGAGAVVLAAGVADVAGMLLVGWFNSVWTSDAIFFGVISAPFMAASFTVTNIIGRQFGAGPDMLRHSGTLATVGIIPVVVLAFVGGALRGSDPRTPAGPLEEFVNRVVYLRLRPTAPPDYDWGFGQTLPASEWLPQTIFAVGFILFLWLVLRWATARHPARGMFFTVWVSVALASAVAGCVDAAVLGSKLINQLPEAVRFGALFGWLPAAAVVIYRRANRTPSALRTPLPTPGDTAQDTPSETPTGTPSRTQQE